MDDVSSPAACRLCGEPLPEGAERCPSCGLAVVTDLPRRALWRLAGGLAAIYLLAAVVLLLTR
jgi:predicted amidophosphoribosyltransferase